MSIAEDIKAKRLTIVADEFAFVLANKKVEKHQAGKHDQKTHGRGNTGETYTASETAITSFQNNSWDKGNFTSKDEKELKGLYQNKYSEDNNENRNSELQVEDYATIGYKNINSVARGTEESDIDTQNSIAILDRTIEQSTNDFGDKTLYRVTSDRVIKDLQPGDAFIDKGFLSTTRKNIVTNIAARRQLGELSITDDTVTVILPSPTKTGKGLAVDIFLESRGRDGSAEFWGKEKEVLLPRETPLLFLGMSNSTDTEGKPVAVFQRMDK